MSAQSPILLAEDEGTDAFMVRRGLQKAGLIYPLIVARDGQEALEYLNGQPPYADRLAHPLPGLLLLDLKMPRLSGFEVLAWLAQRPDLRQIPAVILSSSSYEEDIQKALQLGAREYYIKPSSTTELIRILQTLCARWLV